MDPALRGLAALVVVVFDYHHFYLADYADRPNMPDQTEFPYAGMFLPVYEQGYWAVQLFWVISGFVFAHVYFAREATLWQFSVARFARLYPLHFVTLLYIGAVQLISLTAAGHWQIYGNNNLRHFLLQLTLSTNILKQSRRLSFNAPIWSVSLEMAAYAMFFLALPALRRAPMIVPVLYCALSILIFMTIDDLPVIRVRIFQCAAYFFAGTALYGVCQLLRWQNLSLALLAAVLTAGSVMAGQMGYRPVSATFASTAMITLLALIEILAPVLGRHLRPLGNISYSVYLVHVPLQVTTLLIADLAFGGTRAFVDSWWLLPAYVGVSVALALWLHHRFKKPVGTWVRKKLQS